MNMHGIWEDIGKWKKYDGKREWEFIGNTFFLKRKEKSPNICGIWELTGIVEKIISLAIWDHEKSGMPRSISDPQTSQLEPQKDKTKLRPIQMSEFRES